MELSVEVAELFGPMHGFAEILASKIERRQAFVARMKDGGRLAGGMLIGGSWPSYWIRWLAVRPQHRNCGVGTALVHAAINKVSARAVISVDTFTQDVVEGHAARRLYERCGFVAGPIWKDHDVIRQRFARQPHGRSARQNQE